MQEQLSGLLSQALELISYALVTFAGVLLGVSHTRKRIKTDTRHVESEEAHTDVIRLLRGEVARLAEQNRQLSVIVDELRTDVSDLRVENARLLRAYNAAVTGGLGALEGTGDA